METLETVAHADRRARSAMCILWAMGVTQHSQGSDTSTAISNLLLVTGNYMRPGTGAYPLRGHNNVQGASDHGSMPNKLPGYQSVDDPEVRARFEAGWNVKLPTTKGLDNHQMVEAIHQGKLKAMYLIGEEMSIVDSNANYVGDAFSKLEFFVVQDIFFSRTCQFADVVLPAAPSLEKEGTFTSTERRIQRLYQVFEPLEGSPAGLAESSGTSPIILAPAGRYQHPSEVMDEIASLTPLFAGVSYERLEGYQIAAVAGCRRRERSAAALHQAVRLPRRQGAAVSRVVGRPADQPDAEFDLHLNNGRLLEHFHEGNLTYRMDGIREKTPDTFVEVSPELAEERGIQSGTWVRLISRYGQVRVRALVTDRVQGQELYMPMNSVESPVNRLTSSHTDPVTNTPGVQGDQRSPGRAAGDRREPAASHQLPVRSSDAAARRRSRTQMEACGLSHSRDSIPAGSRQVESTWPNPFPFHAAPLDTRDALRVRLETAPDTHAEALLAAYDLLQALHDRGILDVATSALAASDELLEKVVDTANAPEVDSRPSQSDVLAPGPRQHRAGVVSRHLPGDSGRSGDSHRGARRAGQRSGRSCGERSSKDSLRGLAAAVDFLESFGRHLHSLEGSTHRGQPALGGRGVVARPSSTSAR